jgi:hypothetical protein
MRRNTRRHIFTGGEQLASPISAETFKEEVQSWALRLEVKPTGIHLVEMSRKWASCSPRGRVTFDSTLLRQPVEFRREVIIHELLHLKVRNHGPLFSALLRTHLAARSNPMSPARLARQAGQKDAVCPRCHEPLLSVQWDRKSGGGEYLECESCGWRELLSGVGPEREMS